MTTVNRTEALCACPLFADLPAAAVRDLSAFFEQLDGNAHDRLFLAGEPGGSLYVMVSGTCEARVGGVDGREATVRRICAPDSFGELSLLGRSSRMTSVEALDDVCVLELSLENFARLRERSPELALELVIAIARRAAEAIESSRDLLCTLLAERTAVAVS